MEQTPGGAYTIYSTIANHRTCKFGGLIRRRALCGLYQTFSESTKSQSTYLLLRGSEGNISLCIKLEAALCTDVSEGRENMSNSIEYIQTVV